MRGGSGSDTLHADLSGYTLDLKTRTTGPAALHGTDGVIPFGPLGTSDYYSWTSLLATGTIVDHGVPVRVAGNSATSPGPSCNPSARGSSPPSPPSSLPRSS